MNIKNITCRELVPVDKLIAGRDYYITEKNNYCRIQILSIDKQQREIELKAVGTNTPFKGAICKFDMDNIECRFYPIKMGNDDWLIFKKNDPYNIEMLSDEEVRRIFQDPFRIVQYDAKHSESSRENRWKTLVSMNNKVLFVIYAERNGKICILVSKKARFEDSLIYYGAGNLEEWHPVSGVTWNERMQRMKGGEKGVYLTMP